MALIYVAYTRSDWEAVKDLEDYPCPYQRNGLMDAAVLPRRGDFVLAPEGGGWFRVDAVSWSAFREPHQVGLSESYHAWVDVTVTLVDGDPR